MGPAFFTSALLAATSTVATGDLNLTVEIEPILIDYELPGHPNTFGRGSVGVVGRTMAWWTASRFVRVGAGALGRVPFAVDLERDAAAFPMLAIEVRPLANDALLMRFGTLDTNHGYHPALVDEDRYAYGRNVQETYNRFIVPEAARDLGGDPFVPLEHGAQLIAQSDLARIELFLDWQLVENEAHREKFNFGVLGGLTTRWLDLLAQFRLTHYGGQLFTKSDPIRDGQLDPVRQPESAALVATVHSPTLGPVRADLIGAFVGGHMRQTAGGDERWHGGFEVGASVFVLEDIEVGYRAWLPRGGRAGFVSEDGDPVYRQGRTHRARLGLSQTFGPVTIDGRLDVMVPEAASDKIQYLAVTRVRFRWSFPVANIGSLDGLADASTP